MRFALLKGRNLISLRDLSSDEIETILQVSLGLKHEKMRGEGRQSLFGKTLAMIFDRPSTRTRVSFEAAMTELGGHAQYLSYGDLQVSRGEPWRDTARVLSRYVAGVMLRGPHEDAEQLTKYASIPVISGSTGFSHPCQALTDLLTIRERKSGLRKLRLAICWGFSSEVRNKPPGVIHDLAYASSSLGMQTVIAAPEGYAPEVNQGEVEFASSIKEAVTDADAVYSKSWIPWSKWGSRADLNQSSASGLRDWRLTASHMKEAKQDAIVMHPMPAYRGEEIDAAVLDGPQSVIIDQAENRLHAQKGVLNLLL